MNIIAVTMVFNEAVFLPLWVAYYGRELGVSNLLVVDHGSDDGSTQGLPTQVMRLPRTALDEDGRAAFVSSLQAALLGYYDAVVFTDTDEFLVPDPDAFGGLKACIEARCDTFMAGIGINLLHVQGLEPPLDLARPPLEQRRWVRFQSEYCKPAISRVPLHWRPGFHRCDRPLIVERSLYLFHLKAMDHTLAHRERQKQNAIRMTDSALAQGQNAQYRLGAEAFDAKFFPLSAETLPETPPSDFSFAEDLARYHPDARNYVVSGALATVPPRFHAAIPGVPPPPPAPWWRRWRPA